ncbi:MAG: TatD family hydrolase [Chthonomonadales bacterium]
MLIDTHCHLNHENFELDLLQTVERSLSAGVEKSIVVGFDLASSRRAVELADQFPTIYAAIGIHPTDCNQWNSTIAEEFRSLSKNPKVVAIGEIGLDYHHGSRGDEQQTYVFCEQIDLAVELGLPIIIHCREAYPETLKMLSQRAMGKTGVVMHCFAGNMTELQRTMDIGFYAGFGGVITFKNAPQSRDCLATCLPDKCILETDAPYLAPVPFRGKRNEPSYTRVVAQAAAEIRGVKFSEICEQSTNNALRLFPRLSSVI